MVGVKVRIGAVVTAGIGVRVGLWDWTSSGEGPATGKLQALIIPVRMARMIIQRIMDLAFIWRSFLPVRVQIWRQGLPPPLFTNSCQTANAGLERPLL